MQQTAMERIGQYVKSYNEARGAGNAQLAVQYGELAVREARDELAKPSLYDAHRNYYKTVVDSSSVSTSFSRGIFSSEFSRRNVCNSS